ANSFFKKYLNIDFRIIFANYFENIDYEMYQVRVNLGVSF
ncbi:MAG: hypothetical protein PWP52_1051, partial [Bacteroidales bacterium]|nr:hypothetical protein [Bacteroidales bacterium]